MIQAVESKPGEGMTLRKVSHQGMTLSASQRRRLALQQLVKPAAYRVADAQELNDRFPVMFGPPKPRAPVPKPERDHAYWSLVDSFQKYGRLIPEESFTGTPWLGAAFGYPQENYQ